MWHHHFVIRHPRPGVERRCDIRPAHAAVGRPLSLRADNPGMLLAALLTTTWLALAVVAVRAAASLRATRAHLAASEALECRRARTACPHAQENGPLLMLRARSHRKADSRVRRGALHALHRTPHAR